MRILCIGDSNTWGFDPVNGGLRFENRWPRVLAKLMPEHEIIEEALNGRTLMSRDNEKPERIGIDALKMILMSHKPVDCIILMLGSNDLKRYFQNSASSISNGVKEFVKFILNPFIWEKFYVPKLLVISPILLRDNILERATIYGDFDENSLVQSKQLAAAIEEVCSGYDVEFMRAQDYAEACDFDGLHMDEENHQKLAVAICDKLKTIL